MKYTIASMLPPECILASSVYLYEPTGVSCILHDATTACMLLIISLLKGEITSGITSCTKQARLTLIRVWSWGGDMPVYGWLFNGPFTGCSLPVCWTLSQNNWATESHLTSLGNSMFKEIRPVGRLSFNMELPKVCFPLETDARFNDDIYYRNDLSDYGVRADWVPVIVIRINTY